MARRSPLSLAPRLSVFGNGDYPTPDGTGVRDYIHVMDLVEGHLGGLALSQAGQRFGSLTVDKTWYWLRVTRCWTWCRPCRRQWTADPLRSGCHADRVMSLNATPIRAGRRSSAGGPVRESSRCRDARRLAGRIIRSRRWPPTRRRHSGLLLIRSLATSSENAASTRHTIGGGWSVATWSTVDAFARYPAFRCANWAPAAVIVLRQPRAPSADNAAGFSPWTRATRHARPDLHPRRTATYSSTGRSSRCVLHSEGANSARLSRDCCRRWTVPKARALAAEVESVLAGHAYGDFLRQHGAASRLAWVTISRVGLVCGVIVNAMARMRSARHRCHGF